MSVPTGQPIFASSELSVSRAVCHGEDSERRFAEARIVVVLRGSLVVDRGRRTAVIDPTTALLISAGERLRFQHPRGDGNVYLSISGRLPRDLCARSDGTHPLGLRAYYLLQRLSSAGSQMTEPRLFGESIESAFPPVGAFIKDLTWREHDISRVILREIALRYDEQIGLAELGSKAGVSPFHAARVFRRVVGRTIHQHQLQIRLRHALSLLLETDFDLSRVAVDVGFANHGHFTNHFKRRFGMAPSRIRSVVGGEQLAQVA
jgi:AraC family transcriptional regulator